MSQDFSIEAVSVLEGVTKPSGKPAYQCRVKSYHSQLTYSFDDRWGSWQTTKADDKGNHKEPSVALARAMQNAVFDAIKTGAVSSGEIGGDVNPFKDEFAAPDGPAPAPEPELNPFLGLVANTPPEDNPFLNLTNA